MAGAECPIDSRRDGHVFAADYDLDVITNECPQAEHGQPWSKRDVVWVNHDAIGVRQYLPIKFDVGDRNVKDVLDQLLSGSMDYHSLRADIWKQSHPEFIRTYRSDERRDAADRRQHRRAERRLSAQGVRGK